jgi:hypothetical protein
VSASPETALERVLRHARGGQDPRPAPPGSVMRVRLADRAQPFIQPGLPVVVVIDIDAACHECGMQRGTPSLMEVHDWIPTERRNGPTFQISQWRNFCGHLDLHEDVLQWAIDAGTYRRPGKEAAA